LEGMLMFGRRRPAATHVEPDVPVAVASVEPAEPKRTVFDVVQPMQQVRIRWHTLDGGESTVPGEIRSIDGEMIEVWFDRSAPAVDRFRTLRDDQIWIDAFAGVDTYVFAGWLIGIRPPDSLVIMVKGVPRRDQRRLHVRELVDL